MRPWGLENKAVQPCRLSQSTSSAQTDFPKDIISSIYESLCCLLHLKDLKNFLKKT